jgi:hypothetical protein
MRKSAWLLFSILLLSCNKEGAVPDLGHDYFPIELGAYRVYDVQETTYVNKVGTTENYQLRERITEQVGQGFLVLIERREDDDDFWVAVESIYIRQTPYVLEYRQDNVSYVAMSYPVKVGREWNGNALNNEPRATYRYESEELAGFEEEQIKVVISDLPPNIVERDQRSEVYARGIGLIYRGFNVIEFCQSSCEGVNQPENGRILTQQLIEYGME